MYALSISDVEWRAFLVYNLYLLSECSSACLASQDAQEQMCLHIYYEQ